MSDPGEATAGTDIQNAQSLLRVQSLERLEPGRVRVTWSSVPGKRYRVAALRSITAPDWVGFSAAITASDFTTVWSGGVPFPGGPMYFRIEVVP